MNAEGKTMRRSKRTEFTHTFSIDAMFQTHPLCSLLEHCITWVWVGVGVGGGGCECGCVGEGGGGGGCVSVVLWVGVGVGVGVLAAMPAALQRNACGVAA